MTTNTNAALPDAVRVPLDSLHADAGYLIARLQRGTMSSTRVVEVIRERIDAAKAALTTAAAVPPEGITRDDTVHGETYFTAADMATASAQGFRDGVASVAAGAGSEPVAAIAMLWEAIGYQGAHTASTGNLAPTQKLIDVMNAVEALVTHPSPPEGAGLKLVPVEPTLAMGWAYLDAAMESDPLRTHSFNHAGYRAMIAAAPPASEAKGA